MKRFKVITPKGFQYGGKLLKKGETFTAENKSAHVQTALHFQQIETCPDEDPDAAADEDPKAKDKTKAAAKDAK